MACFLLYLGGRAMNSFGIKREGVLHSNLKFGYCPQERKNIAE
jgi:hypothetical protein